MGMRLFGNGVWSLLWALGGCVPPPPTRVPDPAPLTVRLRPEAVVQRAAAFLLTEGFDVVTSDAVAGVFAARRHFGPGVQHEYYRCRWPKASTADRYIQVAYTVNVSATASADSSSVRLRSSALTLNSVVGRAISNDVDCVSTGALEAKLASAFLR